MTRTNSYLLRTDHLLQVFEATDTYRDAMLYVQIFSMLTEYLISNNLNISNNI